MAERNHVFDAFVLRRWPIGDAHRGVGFLTRERGPLTAIAHGAAQTKGRLKLLTSPVRRVRLKAYHDPVADNWKVVDLEPVEWYGGLGEDLDRSAAASLWSELLWKTQMAGQECEVFELFVEAFGLLDTLPGAEVGRLQVQVLWRALEVSGLAVDFSACSECGRPLSGQPVAVPPPGDPLCPRCAAGRRPVLESGAVDWLLATEVLPLAEGVASAPSGSTVAALTDEAVVTWERILGAPLKSVRVFPGGMS